MKQLFVTTTFSNKESSSCASHQAVPRAKAGPAKLTQRKQPGHVSSLLGGLLQTKEEVALASCARLLAGLPQLGLRRWTGGALLSSGPVQQSSQVKEDTLRRKMIYDLRVLRPCNFQGHSWRAVLLLLSGRWNLMQVYYHLGRERALSLWTELNVTVYIRQLHSCSIEENVTENRRRNMEICNKMYQNGIFSPNFSGENFCKNLVLWWILCNLQEKWNKGKMDIQETRMLDYLSVHIYCAE